ncbi:uncharacterized protein METZ01_LOCUS310512, partial [marine metagenome]
VKEIILSSQETGVLYLYESSSGFVLKSVGDEKIQPIYKGEITNGKPNGFGILSYPYNENSVVGEWKNGKEWNTKHTKKDGTIIEKFENGELVVSIGVLYRGWRNAKVGFYKEKWEGVESEDNEDFGKYEGEINNGIPNGQGTYTGSDGQKYIGEWKEGKWNGQGTETLHDGKKYVGEFKDGSKHGQGTETSPDGRKYEGEWVNGFPNGQGIETSTKGGKYVGGFKYGKYNSQGTYTWSDGKKYVGEYKDGLPNGQGTYTLPNGEKYIGEFKDNKPWNLSLFNKKGNINMKWVNGKKQ